MSSGEKLNDNENTANSLTFKRALHSKIRARRVVWSGQLIHLPLAG